MYRRRRGAIFGNPWERLPATPGLSQWPKFNKLKCNRYPNECTKIAALNVLDSVVALTAYSDGVELNPGCGTIIESHDDTIFILTSGNLIRCPTSEQFGKNALANNITVCAHSYDGHLYEGGEVWAYDFHYNLAVLRFVLETPFHPAKLARIIESVDVHSSRTSQPSFHLRSHLRSRPSELTPGDAVIVLGIYFAEPFEPMTALGEYCLERTKYDCKELFITTCKITRCGDGGPLVNHLGEVIGVAFYDPDSTPCLPISIACKWWKHFKEYRRYCRPFLGLEATNLNAAVLGITAKVIQKFPYARRGVIIEKVIPDSAADLAGILVNDVIIQCDEKPFQSFLELFEMIWEKVGVPTELIIVRADDVTPIKINIVFVEATLNQIYRWPVNNEEDSD